MDLERLLAIIVDAVNASGEATATASDHNTVDIQAGEDKLTVWGTKYDPKPSNPTNREELLAWYHSQASFWTDEAKDGTERRDRYRSYVEIMERQRESVPIEDAAILSNFRMGAKYGGSDAERGYWMSEYGRAGRALGPEAVRECEEREQPGYYSRKKALR